MFKSLAGAKTRRLNWRNKIAECYQCEVAGDEGVFEKILEAVNNNLNSPEAFAIIDNSNLSLEDWQKVEELFGLGLLKDTPDIDNEIRGLISERQEAREARDFAKSDELRDLLAQRGIGVEDTPDGPMWRYIE